MKKRVFWLYNKGYSNKDISKEINIGYASVERYYQSVTIEKNKHYLSKQCSRILGINEHGEFFLISQASLHKKSWLCKHFLWPKKPYSFRYSKRAQWGWMFRFSRNNGITEGFHRKMKLIQRRAYGFRNFENYRLRVRVLCC